MQQEWPNYENRPKLKGQAAVVLQRLVRGRHVHIGHFESRELENKHGFTKQGWGRHYIRLGENGPSGEVLDAAWDRRCDASRWAKRAGVKKITHWWLC